MNLGEVTLTYMSVAHHIASTLRRLTTPMWVVPHS